MTQHRGNGQRKKMRQVPALRPNHSFERTIASRSPFNSER